MSKHPAQVHGSVVPDAAAPGISGLPTRESLHPARKLFHFITGYGMCVAQNYLRKESYLKIFTTLWASVFMIEILRLQNTTVNNCVTTVMKPFLRAHELSKFSGVTYYLAGSTLAVAFFPKHISIIATLCLASLDPIAALFGSLFTKYRRARFRHGKSIIGWLASFITATLMILFLLFESYNWTINSPATSNSVKTCALVALSVAFVAACTEFMVPTPQIILPYPNFPLGIDDNFFIPIVTAFALHLFFKYLSVESFNLPLFLFFG